MALSFRGFARTTIWITTVMVFGLFLAGGPASAVSARPRRHSPSPSAPADTTRITDGSHVLSPADIHSLRSSAADIKPAESATPDPVWIYTTTELDGDKNAFDQHYKDLLTTAPSDVIIIAVNTRSRHIIITSGPRSGLSDAQATQAREDFTNSYRFDSNYGNALNSALLTISFSFTVEPTPTFPATTSGSSHHSGNSDLLIFVILGIVVLIIVVSAAANTNGENSTGSGGRPYHSYSSTMYQDTSTSSDVFDSGGSADSSGGSGGDSGADSGGGSSSGDF